MMSSNSTMWTQPIDPFLFKSITSFDDFGNDMTFSDYFQYITANQPKTCTSNLIIVLSYFHFIVHFFLYYVCNVSSARRFLIVFCL